MRVSVIVPLSPGDEFRDLAWRHVRAWYEEQHEGWEIVLGVAEPFTKGYALAAAARHASGDILVVADADLYVTGEALNASVDAIRGGAAWSMPHGYVYRLSAQATGHLYAGNFDPTPRPITRGSYLDRSPFVGPAGGGIVVTSRRGWDTSGGVDPRFAGWGGDDISFARALDTLVGPCHRFSAPLLHLWHRPMRRRAGGRASADNERLAGAYVEAAGSTVAMRALVDAR